MDSLGRSSLKNIFFGDGDKDEWGDLREQTFYSLTRRFSAGIVNCNICKKMKEIFLLYFLGDFDHWFCYEDESMFF